MELNISDIKVGKRFRKDLGDVDALAASINDLGMLQPIVVTKDHRLVAGVRRLKAAKKLGWGKIPVHVVSNLDEVVHLVRAEMEENTCRKDFSPLEIAEVGAAVEKLIKPLMEERQREHGGTAPGRPKNTSGNLPEVSNGRPDRARDVAAAATGVSPRTYEKIKAVAEAAKEEPKKFAEIAEEMDRTGKVDPAYKKVKEIQHPRPAPPEPKYPHSELLERWLNNVMGQAHIIDVEKGGIKKLLQETNKWDWMMVKGYLLPQMVNVLEYIGRYHQEISNAAKRVKE